MIFSLLYGIDNQVSIVPSCLDPKYVCGKVGNMTLPAMTFDEALERALAQDAENREMLSQARAKICAMNHDIISAQLWSLSGFDPALVHLAELRERFAHLSEEDSLRITLDRLISVYVEGQCRELLIGAGITTQKADQMAMERIPDPAPTTFQILACTDDPLAIELMGYALRLGSLTAHGVAPWNRFKAVMADCFAQQRQPASA